MVTNFHVNAGFAAARLRKSVVGLQVMAVVGYTQAADCVRVGIDQPLEPVHIPHWRTGTVSQFQPDEECREIVLQFQWADEQGTADIGVFEDEDITLLLSPDQLYLLERFK